MGKSRSATVVIAYLMHKYKISPQEALAQVRQAREFCEPNEGFMQQLELYHQMTAPDNVEEHPVYQRWVYHREVQQSGEIGQAPDATKIRFEDEHEGGEGSGDFELKCKKCRLTLAKSQYLTAHVPKGSQEQATPSISPTPSCSHFFLDPLSWMRPELEQGKLDGRLECPKCRTNVGKYAWQGLRCNCGDWIVPAITLAKGRLDESKSIRSISSGIRQPPGAPSRGAPPVKRPGNGSTSENL